MYNKTLYNVNIKNIESHENKVLMAFCHNSISLFATAPVLPMELQMIFTIA